MKSLSLLLIGLLLSSNVVFAEGASKPRYKLLFINSSGKAFNPTQDILNPSADELAADEVRAQVLGAALKSFLPFATNFASGSTSEILPVKEQLLVMASNLKSELAGGLQAAVKNSQILPLTHSFMLIPNMSENTNLFYDADKISMSATEVVNVLSISPTHPLFDSKISEALKQSQQLEMLKAPGSQIIAARSDINIIDVNRANIVLQVLLKLDPTKAPFTEANEKVKFDSVVIPSNTANPPVALLTFNIDASKVPKNPTLFVQLGALDKYEKGKFVISTVDRQKSIPRLEGRAAKSGLSFVAVNIGFTEMQFDLAQLQLSSIKTITQPGLRIGKSSFVLKGFHVSSVDQQFQSEINKKIDAEVQSAIQKGSDYVDSQLMSTNIMDALLTKLLQ